jgi:hypothetical protein
MEKAGAAICLNFLGAAWWSDETTFVSSQGKIVCLGTVGRDTVAPEGNQAYLLEGHSYDNPLYTDLWGFNRTRIDKPFMISQNTEAKLCIGIQSENAYFLYSNPNNPCTDIMLAFGHVAPGVAAQASGTVWIRAGLAENVLEEIEGGGD